MKKTYLCPDCGMDITPIIEEAIRDRASAAGKVRTAKKTEASRQNMLKAAAAANAAYTPEKRKAAAAKRLATLAAKAE